MNKNEYDEITQIMENSNAQWNVFKNELLYSNRFFTKSDGVLEKAKKIFENCSRIIGNDDVVYYRAREYTVEPMGEFDTLPTGEIKLTHMPPSIILAQNTMESACQAFDGKELKTHDAINQLAETLLAEKILKSEWGYSKEESGKPPNEFAGMNRASPKYISYLYLASDVNTALAETHAQIDQLFSVAQYTITKKLRIVDLSIATFENEDFGSDNFFIYMNMNNAFSMPVYSDDKDYILSQYMAEYIKFLGYASIVFSSSRNKSGFNFTLFDDTHCKFICSELHKVENIMIESKRVFPFGSKT